MNLQPRQLYRHTLMRASAGTGKTYQLSNRYLGLVLLGEPVDQILATTFARKAAGEILQRILMRLAAAASDSAECRQLAAAVNQPELTVGICRARLRELVRRLHRLRIGTLDSFFVQMAGSYSLELGLPAGWRIADELEDAQVRELAVQDVLAGQTTAALVTLVNLLSKGEVTRSITAQIHADVRDLYAIFRETVEEVWNQVPRYSLLQDDELAEAIDKLRNFKDLPKHKSIEKAHLESIELAETGEWVAFLSKGFQSKIVCGDTTFYRREISEEILNVYRPLVDHAKAVLVGQLANHTTATFQLLSRFDAAYQQRKHSRQALRFEDITWTLQQAFDGGGLQQVDHRLDGRVTHLLLDEFQDTSLGQWAVIRRFAEQVCSDNRSGTLFCVGDVKQAIYGWRGGVAEIFDALREEFPQVQAEPLSKSYRSSPVVIETVNTLFGSLKSLDALSKYPDVAQIWEQRFQPHSTAREDLPGYCRLEVAEDVGTYKENGVQAMRRAAAEAARLSKEFPDKTVGVLVRTNTAVGGIIRELRQVHDVQASEEGGNPLTDSPAVLLLMSLLTLADHPGDTASRFHVAMSPLGTHLGLEDYRDGAAALELSQTLRSRLLNEGYGPVLDSLIRPLAEHCNRRDLNRLLQFVELAYAYDSRPSLRVDDFLRFIEQEKVQDPTADRVRVMTIHQAKGLEFEIVVLADLGGQLVGQPPTILAGRDGATGPIQLVCRYPNKTLVGLLPRRFSQLVEEYEQWRASESLCVLYVALTRAEQMLHMIVPAPARGARTASLAGLLCEGLAPGVAVAPNQLLWETGDPTLGGAARPIPSERPSSVESSRRSAKPAAQDESSPPLKIQLAPPPPVRRRGLERTSPSSEEGGALQELELVMRLDASGAFEYGTLIHAWMEQIVWLDEGVPDDAALRKAARKTETSPEDAERVLPQFHQLLTRAGIADVLTRSYYTRAESCGWPAEVCEQVASGAAQLEVFRERAFAILSEGKILHGFLDRLVVARRDNEILAADIVDFKTDTVTKSNGQLNSAALRRKVAHYRPQLEAYRAAVAQQMAIPADCITARLLFLNAAEVRTID